MKFIYTPLNGMNDTIKKYNISFVAGEETDVINLQAASKLQTCPYMSVCVEKEEDKPKRKRRTPAEMKEARALEDASK